MDIPPPSPTHILRSHTTPLTTLSISNDNERIYSADSSGLVVVTSTRSLRALASWRAHADGVLGVQECGRRVVTHGRDNKLHIWTRLSIDDQAHIGGSASVPGLPTPTLCYSMDVNALNYCRFSLMLMPANDEEALICIPNLVESSLADIWSLPDCQRIHAAIGKSDTRSSSSDGRTASSTNTGIIMSMHLFTSPQSHPHTQSQTNHKELRLLCAYENGGVILRRYNPTPVPTSTSTTTPGPTPGKTPGKTLGKTPGKSQTKNISVEGIGWDVIWSVKVHVESIMAMSVSKNNTFALTVSADHLIGRYDLTATSPSPPTHTPHAHRTKHPGNGSIAIRDDGRVCAVGGWDGRIRLYSTRTMKPLGTLRYHKSGCQGVVFARSLLSSAPKSTSTRPADASTFDASAREDEEDGDGDGDGDGDEELRKDKHQKQEGAGDREGEEDEELSNEEKAERSRWLVSAGKDGRVAVWVLKDFEKTS